jgi:uncharacterized protein (TIGR02996 family)
MSDEDALLAAIAEHPAEDTPRLMYADWLEEHGWRTRAEFIRVQVEIAHVEELPRIELNQYVTLFQRQQDLLDNHRAELLGVPVPTAADVEFRRGFAWDVALSVFHFHQVGQALATMRPLPRVTVRDSVDVIRAFLGFGVFEDDREVPLVTTVATAAGDSAENIPPPDPGCTPRTWPRLDTLDLAGCRLDDGGLTRLFWSSFPVLADLDLSGNDLSDGAVEMLLAQNLPRQLRRLILGGNDITDAGGRAGESVAEREQRPARNPQPEVHAHRAGRAGGAAPALRRSPGAILMRSSGLALLCNARPRPTRLDRIPYAARCIASQP